MSSLEVVLQSHRSLVWRMDRPWPTHNIKAPRGCSSRSVEMDPFPCYAHDVALVRRHLNRIARRWPLGRPCRVTVLDRESIGRMNGECEAAHNWRGKRKPRPWAASIVLYGKRIPPQPAMTEYLVVHEYGHAVAHAIALLRGEENTEALYREYQRLRRLPDRSPDGGPTWHRSVAEVFANDFRILIGDAVPEFWPHEGIAHPRACRAARQFWRTWHKPVVS